MLIDNLSRMAPENKQVTAHCPHSIIILDIILDMTNMFKILAQA